jgi:hypothetical protein
MTPLNDLLDYCFDGKRPAFYAEFEAWLRNSRRFRTFANVYRVKIRAKLKSARDDARLLDVRAELETALLLLGDERFTVEYEAYAASKQRGPDFTATFKTHTPFNVEVRRLHSAELRNGESEAPNSKLMTVLCDKVGQMPPSIVNLLWLAAGGELAEADLTRAAIALRQLAEGKAEEYFTRRGFRSAADFLRRYGQLSGIVVRQAGRTDVWLNPLARHKIPPEIVTAIRRLNDGGIAT